MVLKRQVKSVEMAQLLRVLAALTETHVQFAASTSVSHL